MIVESGWGFHVLKRQIMYEKLCRKHNDANIVTFGTRIIGIEVALDIIRTFLATEFEGGRHEARVNLISEIEDENFKK